MHLFYFNYQQCVPVALIEFFFGLVRDTTATCNKLLSFDKNNVFEVELMEICELTYQLNST
jgi:hypothetical protein